MPRLEVMPGDEATTIAHDRWLLRGDGCTTFDLCKGCAKEVDGLNLRDINNKLEPQNGEPKGSYVLLAGDCEHPPYEENDYSCVVCGEALTEKDN
jgi:hypothetical protein